MNDSGFTLIEILLVVTIGVVLSTAGFLSYNEYKNRRDLELSLQELSAAVEDVQQRSVTQEDGNRWSIRFTASSTGEDVYQIYTGDTYSTSSVEQSYSFNRPIYFSEPSGDRSVDLNFTPVSGGIDTKKIITISHRNADFRAADIIVSSLGLVTNRMHDDISAYWHFEEGSGNDTADASGQGNDGEVNGASWVGSSNCVVGQCLEFDGTDDYVRVDNDDSLQFGEGSFTATAWIYPVNVNNVRIVNNRGTGSGGSYKGWQLKIDESGGNWFFRDSSIDDASGDYKVCNSCGSEYPKNEWHHVAMVYEKDNELRFYVNGSLDSTVNVGNYGDITNNLPTAIGASVSSAGSEGSTSQFFDGMIDEVRIYNTSLSSSTIKSHYNDLR